MDTNRFPGQFARTQRFSLGVPRAFTLSPDGHRALFLRTRGGEDRTSCLWLLDDDQERLLVNPEALGAGGPVPDAERSRREQVRERAAGLVAYAADAAVRIAAFAIDGRLWVTDTSGGDPRPVPAAGPVTDPRPDPAGRRVAYVTGGALHVVDLADGRDRLLAAPARAQVVWGLAEYVAAESMHRTRGYWWSPDGTALLAARVDTTPVQRWWIADPARLPVLMAPYAGPAMQLVTRARHGWLCEAQWFAESGFAVVIADGRGTRGRGPAWEKAVHLDTLTAPLEDQVVALRAAAGHCPDLDLSRVGIRGWSHGGTLAAAAVLRMPEVFHAAISGAAPSDQRLYDTHWRERFLGHPDEEPESYQRSSPVSEAARLSRPLLLVHGMADDNVVAAHTLRMSAALLAAGRPHQVLPLPGSHRLTAEAVIEGLLLHQLHFLREALNVPLPAAM